MQFIFPLHLFIEIFFDHFKDLNHNLNLVYTTIEDTLNSLINKDASITIVWDHLKYLSNFNYLIMGKCTASFYFYFQLYEDGLLVNKNLNYTIY